MATAIPVSTAHTPEATILRYQVFTDNAPGLYELLLFVPAAAPYPAEALVVLLCHKYV